MRTIDARTQGLRGIQILDSKATASLLSKVLWITTLGFVFTAVGAYFAADFPSGISFFGIVIVNFALIFAINAASKRSPALALLLFYAFTTLMGVQVGPLIKAYLRIDGQSVVFEAALTTALGMGAMALVAQVVRFDWRRVYTFAYAALIGLVIVGVLSMFVHFIHPGLYAWASLAIFSVLLLVDFMRLRDMGAMMLSPVPLALSIYLDALNIFLALLQIFGGGSRNRR